MFENVVEFYLFLVNVFGYDSDFDIRADPSPKVVPFLNPKGDKNDSGFPSKAGRFFTMLFILVAAMMAMSVVLSFMRLREKQTLYKTIVSGTTFFYLLSH